MKNRLLLLFSAVGNESTDESTDALFRPDERSFLCLYTTCPPLKFFRCITLVFRWNELYQKADTRKSISVCVRPPSVNGYHHLLCFLKRRAYTCTRRNYGITMGLLKISDFCPMIWMGKCVASCHYSHICGATRLFCVWGLSERARRQYLHVAKSVSARLSKIACVVIPGGLVFPTPKKNMLQMRSFVLYDVIFHHWVSFLFFLVYKFY